MIRVKNMRSPKSGRDVANQFEIFTDSGVYFQSYNSIIARKFQGTIYLDEYYWDYSRTTGKYRNAFLGEYIAETRKKIKTGEYILTDLNS